jgi:hypothetical protein
VAVGVESGEVVDSYNIRGLLKTRPVIYTNSGESSHPGLCAIVEAIYFLRGLVLEHLPDQTVANET